MTDQQPQFYRSKYGSNKNFDKPAIAPVPVERPLVIPASDTNSKALIPGARDVRQPIIPNIQKHDRKHSLDYPTQLAAIDGSV